MGSSIGREFKRWGRQFDKNIIRGVPGRDKIKNSWDNLRDSTGIFPKEPDPEPTPAPVASEVAGTELTEDIKSQKGRSSTRKVSRTPLGGGATLT